MQTEATGIVETDDSETLAYRPKQAAQVTGISRTEIYAALKAKHLTAHKRKGATLILRSDLLAWLSSLPKYGEAPSRRVGSAG